MEQPAMRVHGVNQRETNQLVDGMSINSNEDCLCMSYADELTHTEVSVTTSALPAESSPGGIRVNSIPRDGGNVVAGAVFFGGTDGNWQADNVDDELRARRIQSANGISRTFRTSTARSAARSERSPLVRTYSAACLGG